MIVKELIRRLIGLMVDDLIKQTKINIEEYRPKKVEDIRLRSISTASFSKFFINQDRIIRNFLKTRVYEHASFAKEIKRKVWYT